MTIHDPDHLPRLIDLFGAAAVDGSGWAPALRALASATGSTYAQLIGIGGPALVPFNISELPQDAERELLSMNGYSPAVNSRVAAAQRVGVMRVASDDHYDRIRAVLATDDYDDFLRRWDIPYACQITLVSDAQGLVGLALGRSGQDGRTDAAALALFTEIAPHVQAAVRTQRALGWHGARLLAGGLEAVESATFVCDALGAVRAMTGRAEAIVLAADILALSALQLRASAQDDDARLRRALGRMLRLAPGDAAVRQESLVLGPHSARVVVQIDALPAVDWSLAFAPRVLVTVRSASVRAPSAETLRDAFSLTASEAAIARDLAAGKSREAIAEARGVAVGTVRQQVKAILQKAGVRREAELLVAIHRLG